MSVYQVGSLLIEANDAPEAYGFAKLLGVVDSPQIIVRPTNWELTDAKMNTAKALAKISDALIKGLR